MPIVPLLESDGSFDPEGTKILTAAFDTAWQMLKTSGNVLAADYRSVSTRDLLRGKKKNHTEVAPAGRW